MHEGGKTKDSGCELAKIMLNTASDIQKYSYITHFETIYNIIIHIRRAEFILKSIVT